MKSLAGSSRVALAIALFVAIAAMAAITDRRAEATVITGSPVPFTATEGTAFNGAVATFTDDNLSATPADFTASIDWGDGSAVTAGSIGESSAAFVVIGQHTYADEGAFTATVTIADVSPGTGTATVTSPATVVDADQLTGTPRTFAAPQGVSFTTTVATFTTPCPTITLASLPNGTLGAAYPGSVAASGGAGPTPLAA